MNMNKEDLEKAWSPIMIRLSTKLDLQEIMRQNELKSVSKAIELLLKQYKDKK